MHSSNAPCALRASLGSLAGSSGARGHHAKDRRENISQSRECDVVSIRLLLSESLHCITHTCHTHTLSWSNPLSVGPPPHAGQLCLMSGRHRQECARIAQTSRSCTSSDGTPKLWFGRIDGGFVVSVGKEYMVTCAVSTPELSLVSPKPELRGAAAVAQAP